MHKKRFMRKERNQKIEKLVPRDRKKQQQKKK